MVERSLSMREALGSMPRFSISFSTGASEEQKSSDAGTRTRVARVKAEYPNQLDYIGIHTSRT